MFIYSSVRRLFLFLSLSLYVQLVLLMILFLQASFCFHFLSQHAMVFSNSLDGREKQHHPNQNKTNQKKATTKNTFTKQTTRTWGMTRREAIIWRTIQRRFTMVSFVYDHRLFLFLLFFFYATCNYLLSCCCFKKSIHSFEQ